MPALLIHATTTRAAKIWPFQAWDTVLHWCARHSISAGLVGAPPDRQRLDYHAGDGEEELLDNHPGTSKGGVSQGRSMLPRSSALGSRKAKRHISSAM